MQKLILNLCVAAAFFCTQGHAQTAKVQTFKLLDAVTTTATGATEIAWKGNTTYQASGTTSAGAGASVILVQVSNDNSNWMTLGTITLTLAVTSSSDGFASSGDWKYVRGKVSSISGTTATVYLWMGR